MKKKNFLLVILGGILLMIIVLFSLPALRFTDAEKEGISVLTEKVKYFPEEDLRVKVDNQRDEVLCFSSCYPYYLQKKNSKNEWDTFSYVACQKEDIVTQCIEPKKSKTFETVLPYLANGVYRLAISACLGCNINDKFEEEKKFYSNEFIVKKN